jgi:tetratricopeptide (TPR) repeat protein
MDRVCARRVRNLLLNLTVINLCLVSAATHLYGIDPAPPDSWSVLIQQADTFHVQLKLADAERSGRQALAAANATASDARLPLTYAVLASIYRDQGRCSDSRASYSLAIALYEKQVNPSPRYVFRAIVGLIDAACECDDFTAAERLFRVYSAQLQKYRTGLSDDAWILEIQAGIARGQKGYAVAEQGFRRAIAVLEENEPGSLGDIVELRNNMAMMVGRQGRTREALKELELVVSQMETISPRFITLPSAMNNVGVLLNQLGSTQEASLVFERALTLAIDLYGEDNRRTAMIMLNYAAVLRTNKEDERAAALQEKAQNAYRASIRRDSQTVDVRDLQAARRTP